MEHLKSCLNFIFVSFAFVSFSLSSQAGYLTLGESGEIIPEGTYAIGASPQVLTNDGGGFNISAFLDASWNDSMSSRFILGTGETDFYTSGSFKFIPFPDVDRQPAIGIKASLWYAREGTSNVTTLQIAPMLSKKYETESGVFIPYAAWGWNTNRSGGSSDSGHQFFLGSDWLEPQLGHMHVTGEVAFDLKDSISSVSLFLSFPFDNQKGFGAK